MTYVFDFPVSGAAKFYIKGNYVYTMNGGRPAYRINGEYWHSDASTTPAFLAKDRYVYEYPPSSTPKYYLG
jgi:hypothetical protein